MPDHDPRESQTRNITTRQALELAIRQQQAGKLDEAEMIYRQILAHQPDQADALNLLGMIESRKGRHTEAVQLLNRAIAGNPSVAAYHNNLGNVFKRQNQFPEAIEEYRRAVELQPDYAEAHNNLANALKDQHQLAEAIAEYRRAMELKPDLTEVHKNLGLALRELGRLTEAIEAFRGAIRIQPDNAEAHNTLGSALQAQGELEAAVACYKESLRLKPNYAEAHYNLGTALQTLGRKQEAVGAFQEAIRFKPDFARANFNLSEAFKDLGRFNEAIAASLETIRLKPDWAEAHNNLGNVYRDSGRFDEAVESYRRALRIKPGYAQIHNNLGVVYKDIGQLDAALKAFGTALELKPDFSEANSNFLYTLHFHAGYDARAIYEEHNRWNRRFAEPLIKFIQPHTNTRDPERRLKIGYVSPDFRDHVVGWNLLGLLREHDHKVLEIFCYSGVLRPDAITEQIQSRADAWRNISTLTDEQAARMIHDDGIDILVDLTLHMAGNRLLVFARKPAPMQVTYLGYCSTTGLETMDYRLSDPYLDPPQTDLSVYTEQTIRLPRTYWCYQPGGEAPNPLPPPALETGHTTFGCLNNFSKVSLATLDWWSKILLADKQTRLLIHANPGAYLDEVRRRFTGAGVSSDRVEFIARRPSWLDYINTFNRIDVALDPFPYCGWITTCDGLWMGVPVVSLSGQTAAGRGGRSILSNVGLPELIAETPEEYVNIAVKLSSDRPRLEELRKTLRARMEASPLMDAKRFAADVEAAYRAMWKKWCSGTAAPQS